MAGDEGDVGGGELIVGVDLGGVAVRGDALVRNRVEVAVVAVLGSGLDGRGLQLARLLAENRTLLSLHL